jgi:hypothetical protein
VATGSLRRMTALCGYETTRPLPAQRQMSRDAGFIALDGLRIDAEMRKDLSAVSKEL